jgi:eukaryotic-like serine/threonine-protein kinase
VTKLNQPLRAETRSDPNVVSGIAARASVPSDAPPFVEPTLEARFDRREPAGSAPSSMPHEGDLLAEKYRVEELIGRGGMGSVFAARHVELGHRVAIKVLHTAGPNAAARFLREAQLCARLASDHVPRVFDLGRRNDGSPYIVMEYLVGADLANVIAQAKPGREEAIGYVLHACAGLAGPHAAGVVHRDLKPANLFRVSRPDGSARILILDFGISKIVGDSTDSGLNLTHTGSVLGSPSYMSPEQIRASRAIDARSDIWSLGVILFELLAGRMPFEGASFPALAVAIATETPAILSTKDPALDAIVRRCLEKDPEKRFPSVTALAEALAPFAAKGGATAGVGRAEISRKPFRSYGITATIFACALVIFSLANFRGRPASTHDTEPGPARPMPSASATTPIETPNEVPTASPSTSASASPEPRAPTAIPTALPQRKPPGVLRRPESTPRAAKTVIPPPLGPTDTPD